MILPLIALIGSCAFASGHAAEHTHIHDDRDNHNWHLVWETSECKVDWTANGEVWFSDDGRDVTKLSPGALLTVVEQFGPHTRRVELYQKGAMLDRTYTLDGAPHPWDDYAADWFADLLVQVDHTTGMLASVRFPKMMAAGGPSAVINDIKDASDFTKRVYMKKLIGSTKLDAEQSCQVASLAEHMNSDYERTELLIDAADQIDFASASCRESYFSAVSDIGGDYDKSRALIAAVDHGPTAGPGLDGFTIATVTAARRIGSDHEKAHVLVSVAGRCSTADTVRTAYLTTARTIGSDTERARALTALIRQQ